uniref:Uncharacterized protein n=1 Tax=Globodera rostochiensis TaxID=31243 RepID=A0A914H273_GLORO
MNSKLLSTLFFALSIAIFASQIDAASDPDTLDGWIREAAKLGLGPAETGALNVLKDVLESVSSDSKRILGMTANDRRGMNGADEAVLRRLVTINGGVKSPKVRTLGELPKITLRAKMKLWLNGYDKETEEAEEDQDNAKRRVKMVLTKLEEGKESELFEKIKPTDYKQLKDMDDTFASKRYKDILTDLSRKSIVQMPGGLGMALKDAAEYVIVAYSNLATDVGEAADLPDSIRKAIGVMREVRETTLDDAKVLGTRISDADFKSIDDAYRGRIASLGLNDESVISLKGLVASLRFITLKRMNIAYEELGQNMPEYRWVESGIKAMMPVEQTVYDLDTFGLRADPENALELDRQYFGRVDGIRRNEHLRRHFGLRIRMEEAIKKLNNDFDSIMNRKATLITGDPKTLCERLVDLDGKADLNLFGNPSDITGLDSEYVKRSEEINTDTKPIEDYMGLKVRSEMAKQRLSRNYFLVADKKGLVSSSEAAEVQNALRKSSQILSSTDWAEMLGNPEMNEQRIEEAFKMRVNELNLEGREVSKLAGLSGALGEVIGTLRMARQTEQDEERKRGEELQKEYDNTPPKEISDECKDEAPNCRENIFLCKNRFYVTLCTIISRIPAAAVKQSQKTTTNLTFPLPQQNLAPCCPSLTFPVAYSPRLYRPPLHHRPFGRCC